MTVYFAGFVPCSGTISVLFPDVPGCLTWGNDTAHAFTMDMEALADDGDAIPAPSGETEAMRKFREPFAGLDMGPMPEVAVLHPVPAPELDTATAKVNVSFARYKLDMIDLKAKAAGMTRSGFLAAAADAYAVE
ncbi:type II toxin-antitoxin system HicB family antitoxin [uncultured Desulfovibrio sp.]|uniref:type II toxin-antitoxin system HicB family antitoxin n=1 Tax=uncultured Desulfovibrio sp. TaxID=167968 RepID=UPI002628E2A2|nr:type II toxin-antitoxin system HicB family antitoxin [uncultured Desulfovibrio sp.]